VGEVRNVGLLGALELVEDKAKRKHFPKDRKVGEICRDICIEKNIVMRAIKDIMVVSPPLIITKEQIDEMHDLVKSCLDLTAKQLGVM